MAPRPISKDDLYEMLPYFHTFKDYKMIRRFLAEGGEEIAQIRESQNTFFASLLKGTPYPSAQAEFNGAQHRLAVQIRENPIFHQAYRDYLRDNVEDVVCSLRSQQGKVSKKTIKSILRDADSNFLGLDSRFKRK